MNNDSFMTNKLIAIIGATASGKTGLAVSLARVLAGEIISADSRQVYRGLDLGSGKDLHEYGDTPYHLIDIINPTEEYNLYRYQTDFQMALADIVQRKKQPILCGGSSLYLHSVLSNYALVTAKIDPTLREAWQKLDDAALREELLRIKPDQHNQTDLVDRDRLMRALEVAMAEADGNHAPSDLPYEPVILVIQWPREIRRERIRERLKQRLDEGMIDEVTLLNNQGVSWDKLNFFGLEYRFIAQYLQGELTYNDMFQKLHSAIARFAKKQDTWLRKMEREGLKLNVIDGGPEMLSQAKEVIKAHGFKLP